MLPKLYFIFALFRILAVFAPQTGYIHPDEFFQTMEISAGDALQLSTHRSWEFNSSQPVRSITFLTLLTGVPLLVVKWMSEMFHVWDQILTSYTVLVVPRLHTVLLSFVVDLTAFQLARSVGCSTSLVLLFHSSSYVTWIYLSRTFSNTVETLIFCLLLLVLNGMVNKSQGLQRNAFITGSILMAGFFNRPTFFIFAFCPCLLGFCNTIFQPKEMKKKISKMYTVVEFIFACTIGVLLTFAALVLVDTVYFRALSLKSLINQFTVCTADLGMSWKCVMESIPDLVITPWNFIAYNTNTSNLAHHGLHPWYLHILINFPLLLGPLSIVCYLGIVRSLSYLWSHKKLSLDDWPPVLMGIKLIFPIVILSLFPHQEPRFLLPLALLGIVFASRHLQNSKWLKVVAPSWILFNVIAGVFCGFLHQGGLVPALMDIYHDLRNVRLQNPNLQTHLVFARTYMPPQHLLLLPQDQNTTIIHDMGGKSVPFVIDLIRKLGGPKAAVKPRIFLYVPSVLASHFLVRLKHKDVTIFCPHFSTEDPPRFHDWLSGQLDFSVFIFDLCLSVIQFS